MEPSSHCGNDNGPNSTTCGGGFKLFGVQIDGPSSSTTAIRKTKSLGNLSCESAIDGVEYLYDRSPRCSLRSNNRKKGVPWSEEEHRSFLAGLQTLGKGDWKGISTKFVPSRNPTQVASHAQKYFIRKEASERRRRRTSVFDTPLYLQNNHERIGENSSSSNPIGVTGVKRPPLCPTKSKPHDANITTMDLVQKRHMVAATGASPIARVPNIHFSKCVDYIPLSKDKIASSLRQHKE